LEKPENLELPEKPEKLEKLEKLENTKLPEMPENPLKGYLHQEKQKQEMIKEYVNYQL